MKNILVTGGLGFIGFNAIQLWKKEKHEYNYIIVDNETYAAQFLLDEKLDWLAKNNIPCFKCDICDEFSVEALIKQFNIDAIVNFAAESHVDNSITGPDIFFKTNIIGTTKLLNLAKKYDLRFHQIGTDEVYGETHPESWTEYSAKYPKDMPIVPSSPYSSSKASADMIALSYHRTFGTKVTVSRCTNNAGKYQHTEKLIGTVISKAISNKKIPVYGEGNQKRHWIHVDDHNRAIMQILESDQYGEIFNIGPCQENYITNIELIKFILTYLNKPFDLIEHVTDRLGHDTTYFLPPSFDMKTTAYTEFMPEVIDWYVDQLK